MNVTRQETCDSRKTVRDLVGTRPLSARSVLASALLGADEPSLPVADLIVLASMFGISPGAARTSLWRMVSTGELATDDASYTLAGRLLERRDRVDDAARREDPATGPWDGTWELAIVSQQRRSAADRLELRKAAAALHLAEIREGVWIRPDNLDPERLPAPRAVLDQQCVHFHHAQTDIAVDLARSLFPLDEWAHDARRLIRAMEDDRDTADFAYQFALSIAVVRHLQLDPLLPQTLNPKGWPANKLRDTYRRFDRAFKRRLNNALRAKVEHLR